jgi:hypothetical protein
VRHGNNCFQTNRTPPPPPITDPRISGDSKRSHGTDLSLEASTKLNEVKAALPHGEFGMWLEGNCRVKHRQAQRYMKLANEMPHLLEANTSSSTFLGLEAAMTYLSAPEEVKAEVEAKLEAG